MTEPHLTHLRSTSGHFNKSPDILSQSQDEEDGRRRGRWPAASFPQCGLNSSSCFLQRSMKLLPLQSFTPTLSPHDSSHSCYLQVGSICTTPKLAYHRATQDQTSTRILRTHTHVPQPCFPESWHCF